MTINKVTLIGNVGKDPEIKKSQNGFEYAVFTLATSKKWKDSNTGEKRERTTWHNITTYNKSKLCSYIKKGDTLYIEGEISYHSYEKNEVKAISTTINAHNVEILKNSGDFQKNHSIDDNQSDEEIPF